MVKRFKLFETPPSMDNDDAIALANWAFNKDRKFERNN